jgi:hypothetical protein
MADLAQLVEPNILAGPRHRLPQAIRHRCNPLVLLRRAGSRQSPGLFAFKAQMMWSGGFTGAFINIRSPSSHTRTLYRAAERKTSRAVIPATAVLEQRDNVGLVLFQVHDDGVVERDVVPLQIAGSIEM